MQVYYIMGIQVEVMVEKSVLLSAHMSIAVNSLQEDVCSLSLLHNWYLIKYTYIYRYIPTLSQEQ